MKHRLGGDVHGQAVAVEARDGGVRLEAGMRLGAGAEGRFDQPRIFFVARGRDPALCLLALLRKRRRRPPYIAVPGGRRRRAFGYIAGALAAGFFEHHGRIGFSRGIEADRRRQRFAGEADCGERRERGLAVLRRHRGDRVADIADHAVVAEQRDHGADARVSRAPARDRVRRCGRAPVSNAGSRLPAGRHAGCRRCTLRPP